MIVLFCGKGHFQEGFVKTKESLKNVDGVEVIECERADISNQIVYADVVVPLMSKITRDVIMRATKLKLIIQFGAGIEGIDIEAAREYGILVSKIPTNECSNALSCAEHAIFLSLSLLRDYNELQISLRNGVLGLPCGKTLFGSNIAIMGFGGIGIELVKRLSVFGVNINVIVRTVPQFEESNEIVKKVNRFITMDLWDDFAVNTDIIILCVPLTKETNGIINKKFLENVKNGAILINIARGGLLNYDDVLDSLNDGKLGGLGIDVYHTEPFPTSPNDPILSHPKVIATPHVAGVTQRSYQEMADIVAYNVKQLMNNQPCSGVVNHDKIINKGS